MNTTKKHSVLVVDDNISSIDALRSILNAEYKVYAVKDSNLALETAERTKPDIILLDIIMPDLDGYDVVALLKESEKTKDIPVIFITGLDSANAEEKGLTLGASDYISKPFHSGIVNQRVRNQIKLVEQLKQQTLMARISHHFLTDTHSDLLFSDALRMVGEFMGVAQVFLFKNDNNNNVLECSNEWINPKFDNESLLGYKFEIKEPMLSLLDELLRNEKWYFGITSNDPSHKEISKPYRTRRDSFISIPLYVKGRLCAVLDFSGESEDYEWSVSEIDLAALVAGVFSGVFERDAIEHDLNVVTNLKADLLSAKENAEYLSRVKSLFLSRMSHEMRTPMNAIMGMMQVIKKREAPENIKGCLETIDKESRHLLSLIDSVLDVSDIEYGIFTIKKAGFNWPDMINDVLIEAERNASVKSQTIKSDIDPAIPSILTGDEIRLRQVISNFMTNAVKYTPENGSVELKAQVLNEDNETITLEIKISDDGIGISKEQQSRLFDMFEQIDGGNTRKQGGIGIGLALSQRIVEMMDGTITVESELGKGAVFTFTCKLDRT